MQRKLVRIKEISSADHDINFKYIAKKPTQLSSFSLLQQVVNVVQRMYDNNFNDDNMELVHKAAENHLSWIAVCVYDSCLTRVNGVKPRGYYLDLRPEKATMKDHLNQHI